MPKLLDEYILDRASRYSNPRRENDILPIPWGDLTVIATKGVWQIPCIDTENRVYCVAGCPILSVANGQDLTVFNKDGEEIGSGGYAFDESDDYESQGNIAKITFPKVTGVTDIAADGTENKYTSTSTDLSQFGANSMATFEGFDEAANNGDIKVRASDTNNLWPADATLKTEAAGDSITITADQSRLEPLSVSGKGRADADTGALVTSPPTQVEDFILSLGGFDSDFFEATPLARAKAIASARNYSGAGVLDSDQTYANFITEILSSFLGGWWKNAAGKLKVRFDLGPGALQEGEFSAVIIRTPETRTARMLGSLANICNQAPADYAYNWANKEFDGHDDGSTTRDLASIAKYSQRSKTFSFKWVRSSTTVQALQTLLVSRFKDAPRQYEVDMGSLRAADLEAGDYGLLSSDWIQSPDGEDLKNQIIEILQINTDLDLKDMTLTCLDTGYFKTRAYLADGSCMADGSILGGSDRDLRDF